MMGSGGPGESAWSLISPTPSWFGPFNFLICHGKRKRGEPTLGPELVAAAIAVPAAGREQFNPPSAQQSRSEAEPQREKAAFSRHSYCCRLRRRAPAKSRRSRATGALAAGAVCGEETGRGEEKPGRDERGGACESGVREGVSARLYVLRGGVVPCHLFASALQRGSPFLSAGWGGSGNEAKPPAQRSGFREGIDTRD